MTMHDKVLASLESYEAQRDKMVRAVRRAYEDGRWAAATQTERNRTKYNFQTNRKRRVELIQWLMDHLRRSS